jgi:hypothetical protein
MKNVVVLEDQSASYEECRSSRRISVLLMKNVAVLEESQIFCQEEFFQVFLFMRVPLHDKEGDNSNLLKKDSAKKNNSSFKKTS